MLRELKISASQDPAFAQHTPPLEAEIVSSSTTAVSPRLRPQTSVEELKASARSSRTATSTTSSAKCGDAVGQPRKGTGPVRPDSIVEVDEEAQEEVQYVSTRIGYREPTLSSSQPSRGTKRGAGRVPVDKTPSSTRTQLEIPSTLARSTSTASMQSTNTDIDDRAHKRRPVKTSPITRETRAYHHEITDMEPLTPSRKVNVKVIEEVTTIETKIRANRPSRNGSEMVRPPPPTSSPATPLSKLKFGIARKSPPTEEVTTVPAAPELARTKAVSREGALARAGRDQGEREREKERERERKEKEKMTSPPRFGARLLSRLGATGKFPSDFVLQLMI